METRINETIKNYNKTKSKWRIKQENNEKVKMYKSFTKKARDK